ncbi:MAG: hypothetical protein FIA92_06585 [Chloroflexi bacterium]|nr:hypothetical protein [Chloroflexota bacterium]
MARGLLASIVVAFFAVACTTGSDSGGGGGAGGGAGGDASIGFASPGNGTEVSIPFEVQLDASVPLGDPSTGNHHAHIYYDVEPGASDYDIVYGTSAEVPRPLSSGEHTLTVALANPDHSLAGPSQQITVTVGSSGAGSEASPGGPAPGSTGLDY